jgi:hypothetical protein
MHAHVLALQDAYRSKDPRRRIGVSATSEEESQELYHTSVSICCTACMFAYRVTLNLG